MADSSFIAVPPDATENPVALRRFLLRLIEQLDIAFGNRGSGAFNTSSDAAIVQLLAVETANKRYVHVDGSVDVTGILSYNTDKTFLNDEDLIAKKYADDNFTDNPAGTDPGDLALVASAAYVQAELQAVADKGDAILAELRTSNLL